jgi:hypothetical protein
LTIGSEIRVKELAQNLLWSRSCSILSGVGTGTLSQCNSSSDWVLNGILNQNEKIFYTPVVGFVRHFLLYSRARAARSTAIASN